MPDVVVAGHICVDLTPDLPPGAALDPGALTELGRLTMSLGGCVANTGGVLAGLGIPTRLAATIGDDDVGQIVRRLLSARNQSDAGITIREGTATSYSLVLQPGGADRTIWHHTGANAHFDGAAVDLAGASLLHVGYPPLLRGLYAHGGRTLSDLLRRARAEQATTSLDMAVVDPLSDAGSVDWAALLAEVLGNVDVFSPSIDDLTSALRIDETVSTGLVERLADRALDWGAAVVAISAGARGLYLRTAPRARLDAAGAALSLQSIRWADRRFWQPPFPVSAPTSTNGAGDAATAGLLAGLWSGLDPESAARRAAACAAAVITGTAISPEVVADVEAAGGGDEAAERRGEH